MDDKEFALLWRGFLGEIIPFLEKFGCDVDENGDSLECSLPPHEAILINAHRTLRQIWVASPWSGGHHFLYDSGSKQWIDTRDSHVTLKNLLTQEFIKQNPSTTLA